MNMKNLKGMTLTEIGISIGLAALVLPALIILSSTSIKTATSSVRRSEASKLALSGIEAIRFLRDRDGLSSLTSTCYQISSGNITPLSPDCNLGDADTGNDGWVTLSFDTGNIFDRQIYVVDHTITGTKRVVVNVRWQEGPSADGYKTVSIDAVLSAWKKL